MHIATTKENGIVTKTMTLDGPEDFRAHGDDFLAAMDSFNPNDEDVVGLTFIFKTRDRS